MNPYDDQYNWLANLSIKVAYALWDIPAPGGHRITLGDLDTAKTRGSTHRIFKECDYHNRGAFKLWLILNGFWKDHRLDL